MRQRRLPIPARPISDQPNSLAMREAVAFRTAQRRTRFVSLLALFAILLLVVFASSRSVRAQSTQLERLLKTQEPGQSSAASVPLPLANPLRTARGDSSQFPASSLPALEPNSSLPASNSDQSRATQPPGTGALHANARTAQGRPLLSSTVRRDSAVRPASFQEEGAPAPTFDLESLERAQPRTQLPEPGSPSSGSPRMLIDDQPFMTDEPQWNEPENLDQTYEPSSPLLEPIPDFDRRSDGTMRLNPLALQQGAANLAMGGDQQTPRERLGFPFSVIPEHWGHRLPKLSIEVDLPDSRHVGRGGPLVGTSWRNRPFHIDALTGAYFAGTLTGNGLEGQNGMLVGTRLGWDFNHYVGAELRLAQADVGLVGRLDRADIRLYDVVVNYYPWGDSRVRPFTTFGFGITEFRFVDSTSLSIQETVLSMPFGGGVKFYASRNLALRFELIDNLTFGSDVMSTMNNLSLTGGVELRFGGPRRNYYPYQASARVW